MRTEEEIYNYIVARSDRTLDPQMVKVMINWLLAVVVNKKKRTINIGHSSMLMNYYGLVFAKSNSGKEQPYSEPILTLSGWTTMGELSVGDNVVGSNGKAISVLDIHEQGLKDVYEVMFDDGTSTRCGIEHLWKISLNTTKTEPTIVNTKWLIKNKGYINRGRVYVKNVEPIEYSKKELKLDPYYLGLLLGDGSFTGAKSRICFTNGKEDILNSLISVMPQEDRIGHNKFKQGAYHVSVVPKDGGRGHNEIYSKTMTELELFGLNGKYSHEKFIPNVYKTSNIKDRKKILQGLIDTDGYNKGVLTEYSTSSEQLANDVVEIARSLGISTKITSRIPMYMNNGEKKKGKRNYRVWLRWKKTHKVLKSVTKLDYEENSRCITVDAIDSLYVTKDFIVTHNTYILNLLLQMFDDKTYAKMLMSLFEQRTSALPTGDTVDTAMQKKFIKSFPPIKKDSTTQAIHKAAEAIGTAAETNGSFNIYSDEFFANASEPILDMLVEGHDGIYKAPMIKGKKDEEFLEYADIEGLTTNVLGLSSVASIMKDQKRLTSFIGEMERAWFKRSYVYFNDRFMPKAKDRHEITNPELSVETRYLFDMSQEAVAECPNELEMSELVAEAFDETRKAYINGDVKSKFANLLDVYKTLKLAGILCAANHRTTIDIDDWEQAKEFDMLAFKDAELFCSLEHPHLRAFQEILKGPRYENELVEDGILPATKKTREDVIDLVDQMAYTKNKRLVLAGKRARKISIDELEVNKLDKMVISTSVNNPSNKPEVEVNFKSQEVPFFGEVMTVQSLVTSDVQSYCLNHFEASDKAPDGHRKKEYVIPGQNMLGLDIDEGLTIHEAQEKMSMYQYILYTTKSHQKDKNGIICDRFRILIPTKTMFYVDPEQHKGLYENITKVLDIPSYDIATRNQGRLWFTNPTGGTLIKDEGDLLDVRCCIPETEASAHIIPNLENLDIDESDRRIAGMQKYVLINGIRGNRNNVIFALAKFVGEMGGDIEDITYKTNAMLSQPLPETEVRTIIRNIR